MQYFFSWGLLFILPFTIFAYFKASKSVRIKMIVSGVGFGIMALGFDYIYLNYWTPTYLFQAFHVEDFLYGFLFAGILPAVHNIINNTELSRQYGFNLKLALLYLVIFFASFPLCTEVLKVNYIYALSMVPLIIGIVSFFVVKGKLKDLFLTGLISLFITIIYYNLIMLIYPNLVNDHFLMKNLLGFTVFNIPFEELLFAFCIGIGCTYTYEAIFCLKSVNVK